MATAARAACIGDCNGDGRVAVNELIGLVNIALGNVSVVTCPEGDANSDELVSINELVASVGAALNGCPATPAPTRIYTEVVDDTPTSTATLEPLHTPTPTPEPTATPTTFSADVSPTPTSSPTTTVSPTPLTAFTAMEFHDETVSGTLPTAVTLDGILNVSEDGFVTGQVVATYGDDGLATVVAGPEGAFAMRMGTDELDLLPGDDNSLAVNGVAIAIDDAFTGLATDAQSGTGPEAWSIASQGLLVLAALSSTQSWSANAAFALASSGAAQGSIARSAITSSSLAQTSTPPVWCKFFSAFGAVDWNIFSLVSCAVITGGCVAGEVPTLGAITIPCIIAAGGICGDAGYSVGKTYKELLKWWKSQFPEQSAFCNGCCSEMLNGCPVVRVDDRDEVRCMSGCDCNYNGEVNIAEVILSGCNYSGTMCLQVSTPQPNCGF